MNPTLSSTSGSGQNEPSRIKRLDKVSKIYSIQVEDLNEERMAEINSLHDHKGELSVTWNSTPTEEQKTIIKLIWELQNENGNDVVHKT